MSRSYKHTPVSTIQDNFFKRVASHKVRKKEDLPNGNAYKKNMSSYDICDFKSFCSSPAHIRHMSRDEEPTAKDLRNYRKWYRQK